jgi:hypothetical protein
VEGVVVHVAPLVAVPTESLMALAPTTHHIGRPPLVAGMATPGARSGACTCRLIPRASAGAIAAQTAVVARQPTSTTLTGAAHAATTTGRPCKHWRTSATRGRRRRATCHFR